MAYKITTIVDRTYQLQVTIGNSDLYTIPKSAIKLRLDGSIVWLTDSSQSALSNNGGSPQIYRLIYSDITAPVTLSASALLTAVLAMVNNIPSPPAAGDATSANQVIEIARLQSLIDEAKNSSGVASVYKDPSTDTSWFGKIYNNIFNSGAGVSWFATLYVQLTDTLNTGRSWGELFVRQGFAKANTTTLSVTPAGDATFATAQASLQADLQTALRGLVNYTVMDIASGIEWDSTNSVWQGWAIISYNISLV